MTHLGTFTKLLPGISDADEDAAIFVADDHVCEDGFVYFTVYKKAPARNSTRKPNVIIKLTPEQRDVFCALLKKEIVK